MWWYVTQDWCWGHELERRTGQPILWHQPQVSEEWFWKSTLRAAIVDILAGADSTQLAWQLFVTAVKELDRPPCGVAHRFSVDCLRGFFFMLPYCKCVERAGQKISWNKSTLFRSEVAILAWLVQFMLTRDANYYYFIFILIKSVKHASSSIHPKQVLPELKQGWAELHWDPPLLGLPLPRLD